MVDDKLDCCCCDGDNSENCIICGKPLVYFQQTQMKECLICHRLKAANAACEDGHFVCDDCHSSDGAGILGFLLESMEKDPIVLYLQVCAMRQVHLHGPEHHSIVPCVLLTAYHNCGGDIEIEECLNEAWKRGRKVPGGACGFLGVCGAAAGAGIFVSILTEATPLTADVWSMPQRMTAECLLRMAEVGGSRCCKRTGRIAIEAAAEFAQKNFDVDMPVSRSACTFSEKNRECLHECCPFYGKEKSDGD